MKTVKVIFIIAMLIFSFEGSSTEAPNIPQNEQLILKAKKYVEENLPEYSEMDNVTYKIISETEKQVIVSVVALTVITERAPNGIGGHEVLTSVIGAGAELYFDKEDLKLVKVLFGQ